MSSSEATTAAQSAAVGSAAGSASSLAGLIGVLDRAGGAPSRQRPRPVHTSAARGGGRQSPLRSVQPAPVARPGRAPAVPAVRTPRVTVVPEPERTPITGLRDLARRCALWGSGPHGEYLAWRTPAPAARAPRRVALRALARRAAFWGAGPRGEHLAWGGPAPEPVVVPVDPPVVLRELPSTPTIRPAAPSPAAALRATTVIPPLGARPDGPPSTTGVARARRAPTSPVGPRWAPPPPGWPRPPAWRVPPQPSAATLRTPAGQQAPNPAHAVPAARSPSAPSRAGPARARGDPSSCPARGSPRSVPRPASAAPG